MSHRDRYDVIVIGAGASGLAATTALHAGGRKTVCLEARGRVGGRLLAAASAQAARALDLGATWFWDGEERVKALVARHGVETFDHHLAGDTILHEATGTRRLTGNLLDAPSYRFATGAPSLASALADALPTNTVHLNSPVTALRPHRAGGMELYTSAVTLHADHVVVAVPPALAVERIDFGGALPAELVHLARSTPVWMGAVVKVVAEYSSAFWRDAGLAGAAFSRTGPLQEIHDMSGPSGRPAALFGFAHASAVVAGFAQAVVAQLAQCFGPSAARPDVLHVQNWADEAWTSPRTADRLADYSLFGHPLYQRPTLDGRLHWASTETATDHAGHIEGALTAGERAARAVLAEPPVGPPHQRMSPSTRLGRPLRPARPTIRNGYDSRSPTQSDTPAHRRTGRHGCSRSPNC